ncbi:MAG: hypothetical protein A2270_10650 [Elusimicrobia bacterium RIFOXYA12_FULL_51_18]|nr:MAG: hypothetical protein A2270_10650 [Elusimicrobia bacterium RIFOXYA12_FULL_51_18]OGS29476.1 MAG: hypothetical protein A2218_00540 [Elusimicrobia bacterium RIFOXYA2_FULL_53_38]
MNTSPDTMDESQLLERLKSGDPTAQRVAWERYHPAIYRAICGFTRVRYNQRFARQVSDGNSSSSTGQTLWDGIPGQDDGDAKDVLMATFVDFYKDIHKFNGKSRLSTWLYRIAINNAKDFYRDMAKNQPRQISISTGQITCAPEDEANFNYDDTSADTGLISIEEEPFKVPSRKAEVSYSKQIKKRRKEAFAAEAATASISRENEHLKLEIKDGMDHLSDAHRVVLILRQVEGKSIKETAEILNTTEGAVKMAEKRAVMKLRDLMSLPTTGKGNGEALL